MSYRSMIFLFAFGACGLRISGIAFEEKVSLAMLAILYIDRELLGTVDTSAT